MSAVAPTNGLPSASVSLIRVFAVSPGRYRDLEMMIANLSSRFAGGTKTSTSRPWILPSATVNASIRKLGVSPSTIGISSTVLFPAILKTFTAAVLLPERTTRTTVESGRSVLTKSRALSPRAYSRRSSTSSKASNFKPLPAKPSHLTVKI